MKTKRSNAGELIIDHRCSPGITPEFAAANGLSIPVVGAGRVYETGLLNCRHCGNDVLLHPMRTRERAWCMSCDAYICDDCGVRSRHPEYVHKTMQQIIAELFELAQKVG